MKKFVYALAGVLALTFVSCSSDDNEPKMKNTVEISCEEGTLYDSDTTGKTVTVTLASTESSDVTVSLKLTGDDANAFELSPTDVTISAGSKTATSTLRAKADAVLSGNETLTVTVDSIIGTNFNNTKTSVTVNASPAISVSDLTEAQLNLVSVWKTKFGIDVRSMLGLLDASTTVSFSEDDKYYYNDGEDTKKITGQTAVTISDNATESNIVLKMTANPMGMGDFIYNMFKAITVDDAEYWQLDPINAAILEQYPLTGKETFDVTLDNIVVNVEKKTLDFTGATVDAYGEEITGVPFAYVYSAYESLKTKAASGSTLTVDEGESKAEYTLSEILSQYQTLNPDAYLGITDITEDQYYYDPSNWIEANATFDLDKKTMNFAFPWDFSGLYDYLKVNVTYTLH